MAKQKAQSFEKSMSELEEIVSLLESKDMELEKSLDLFEKGVKLYSTCKKQLGEVEKKISILTEKLKEENGEIDE